MVLLFLLLLLWFTVHLGAFKAALQNLLSLFVICVLQFCMLLNIRGIRLGWDFFQEGSHISTDVRKH